MVTTEHFSDADRDTLDAAPWLQPFINPDDTSLEPALDRYERAMAECRAELRATGRPLYRRQRTADGQETTALHTHLSTSGAR